MNKLFVSLAVVLFAASIASAQTYYIRGDFDGWDTSTPLVDLGGGHYSYMVTGQTPYGQSEYKLASADWSESWPGSNGKIQFDSTGSATFNLWRQEPFVDGYSPSTYSRVGYDNNGSHGWDVMGSFDGWAAPVVTLTNIGSSVYQGDYTVPTPGTYQFKFRKAGDWAISIGDNFGNSAADNSVTTSSPNEVIRFTLDLPNGRWQVLNNVPEPASIGLLSLLATGLLRRRRH